MIPIRRALLSAYRKEGLDHLAAALRDVEAEILSTGGTYRWLRDAGFDVVALEEWAGLPSLFGGRVKTLHPKVHGGILYRRGDPKDEEERHSFGIEPIDLVAIDLYPFEQTILERPDDLDGGIEMIDVGGPTMLRAAAKNHRSVAVLCDPADFERVADRLREGRGALPAGLLRDLAAKVFRRTARYDAAIALFLDRGAQEGIPESLVRGAPLLWPLRYGENPSQRGAYFGPAVGFPGGMRQLQGKEVSFNNLLDLDAATALARDLGPGPAAVVVKHASPCGAAIGGSLLEAYRLARATDSLSAFGGVAALNGTVDAACAEELASTFLELITAPRFDDEAREAFARKKGLILLEGETRCDNAAAGRFAGAWFRSLGGGILAQDPLPDRLGEEAWRVVTRRAPTEAEHDALLLAWKTVRATRSNAIVLSGRRQVIGIGGGQTSRIDALWVALHKARREGHEMQGAAMASDAFFPFPDCVEEAGGAGITAIVQPGGSKRDGDSVEAADRLGIAMVVNDARCFRHG